MRQGRIQANGTWTGRQEGGVKAPSLLILPDQTTRFACTATRLEFLSADHPMAAWLAFLARLAEAQQAVAITMEAVAGPSQLEVEAAVKAGLPVLGAGEHRRDPVWREGLAQLLDALDHDALPEAARLSIAALRNCETEAVEALADDVLRGSVEPLDFGTAFYVTAALQVYFTCLAGSLSAPSLQLLPQRSLCPCCGSTPVSGVVTQSDQVAGVRYLHCSLCATAWNYVRAICITCGQSGGVALKEIEGGSGAIKAETCDDCQTYGKMLYEAQDTKIDAFADDLATLDLDIMVAEAGWSRHAPNPLLLALAMTKPH